MTESICSNGSNVTSTLPKVITVLDVRGYEKNGVAYLHIEDVARGLGFTTVATSGNECVRWNRVEGYLSDLKFIPTSGDGENPHDYYIPENIFYRLCMKAKNEVAEAFQAKVADEIIPAIRKTGFYAVRPAPHTFAEALRAYADEVEARERAEAQRDEAVRTKSEIGSRREATAMNTASQKSKQVGVLETKLGYAEERAKFNPTRTVREWYSDEKYGELFTNFLKVKRCERKEFFAAYERYAELAGRRMTDGNLIYFDKGRVYVSLALVRAIDQHARYGLIAFGEDGSDGAGLAKFTVGTPENREYLRVRP